MEKITFNVTLRFARKCDEKLVVVSFLNSKAAAIAFQSRKTIVIPIFAIVEWKAGNGVFTNVFRFKRARKGYRIASPCASKETPATKRLRKPIEPRHLNIILIAIKEVKNPLKGSWK